MNSNQWHCLEVGEVLRRLQTTPKGLSRAEAARRRALHGPNRLEQEGRIGLWTLLYRQFLNVMIVILLLAGLIAWLTGDPVDALMILIIVILNTALGFIQEYRAERALEALRRLEQPQVVVQREGEFVQIPSDELVPGDVMILDEGQKVPADARMMGGERLHVDEAHLTGESVSVTKQTEAISGEAAPLGDRSNMVFMGTTVTAGHATAVVTETGMKTELGEIADLLQKVPLRQTPLQLRLARLGKWLAVAALVMTGVIFVAGLLRGEPLELMLLTAISLAVAVIPEGLPAVVTIVLALGAQVMVRRNALIRKLPAVETLGSVTTICSDKTGTLTQNVMLAETLGLQGRSIRITGHGYLPEGQFVEEGRQLNPSEEPAVLQLLRAAALCTNARLQQQDGEWVILGDSTEGALLVAAAKAGLRKDALEREYPRIREIPFDSVRKRMTSIHRDGTGALWAFMKGSMEEVLGRSTQEPDASNGRPLDPSRREDIEGMNQQLAGEGVRVLACAMRRLPALPEDADLEKVEERFVFLGLIGMSDPPRPEVEGAVALSKKAGIRPVMITGDHRMTAEAIAKRLGIHGPGDRVLTGQELEGVTPENLQSLISSVSVYARVSPSHKVKIVEALKQNGEIVAMTGDGVNDAPALRRADIGVAMGRKGTDVAREAADMVLLDDNFATIIAAVESGRMIYDNIRKFTRYMLSTNSGEILTMFFAILFALPLPLLPVQILWINLVTDGVPALALGVEPPERQIMQRPPRHPAESIFAGGLGTQILWAGLLMGLGTIGIYAWAQPTEDVTHARTMAFLTLTMFQLFNVMGVRSERDPLWVIGLLSNAKLLAAVVITVGVQFAITYVPFLQMFFHTSALTEWEVATCLVVSSTIYFAVEAEKWYRYPPTGEKGS